MTEPPDRVEGLIAQPLRYGVEHRVDRAHPMRVRAQLSYALLGLLAAVIAVMAAQTFRGYLDTQRFVDIVFPAAVASTATAIGFYFSDRADH